MFTILIADDNTAFAKLLVNDIVGNMNNLRVVRIATDGKETLELMNSQQIDIVLLDIKMPIYDGIQILSMLSEEKKKEYKNSIIVVTGEPDYIPQLIDNPMVAFCVTKGAGQYDKIIKSINKLVEEKSESLKYQQIINELRTMGYSFNLIGTQYLTQAIFEIYQRQDIFHGNLEKEIYPILSLAFKKSVHNIKCNITRATEHMNYHGNEELLKQLLGTPQPTTKLVINFILNQIS